MTEPIHLARRRRRDADGRAPAMPRRPPSRACAPRCDGTRRAEPTPRQPAAPADSGGAAGAHDRARPPAHARAPPQRARGGALGRRRQRARAPAPRGREHRLRRQAGRQVGLAVDPPGRGARADRALGLRQDDAAAHAQPPHRADPERRPRRATSCSTARTSTSSPTRRCARAWRWSSSSPTRSRCRSSTTSPSRCANSRASARAGASSSRWSIDALERAGPLRRGPRRPRPARAAPLRRPAAAAVHRARDRAAARRCC